MTMRLTEGEFHKLGLAIDPGDPSKAVPIASLIDALPDEYWDLDRLARYASTGLAEATRLEHESIQIGRKSTVQIYRSGRALSIARRRLKAEGRGRWGRWLKVHGIKRTTAWEATELFERAGSEDEVATLTPSEAKNRYEITRPSGKDLDDPEDDGAAVHRRLSVVPPPTEPPLDAVAATQGEPAEEEDDLGDVAEDAGDNDLLPTERNVSADDLLTTLIKIGNVLKYLEADADRVEWRGIAQGDFLGKIDEGIEAFTRLRERIESHAS